MPEDEAYVGNMFAECQTDRRPSTWTTMPSAWHTRPAPPSGSQGRGGSFGSAAAAARTRAAASRALPVASGLGLASDQAQAEPFAAFHCAAGSACASSSA